MANEALSILCEQLSLKAGRLLEAVDKKDWEMAEAIAKDTLSMASRAFSRISAIRDAQRELER